MNEKTYEYIYQIAEDCDGVYCYIKQGELVRCKDCADWQSSWHPMGVSNDCHYCATMDCYMKADDYCSYGEKDGAYGENIKRRTSKA